MKNNPLKIGVTGGIGSGKSIICRILRVLGYPVYEADQQAKYLMNQDEELKQNIRQLFGSESYGEAGLNRVYLAKKIFHSPEMVEKLNAIVHPAVARDFGQWVENCQSPVLFKEAALLFESGSHTQLDKIILVVSPLDLRIGRILSRDPHRSHDDVMAIIHNQWDDAKKIALSDFVIHNDEKMMLLPQVTDIVRKLNQKNLSSV
ncbi:MAG: dephospho-CoA kinase [Cyclobacteriaceae bacterium]|nr:dephospho-CoA kinase [Cyclobacteriaceae bacterium]